MTTILAPGKHPAMGSSRRLLKFRPWHFRGVSRPVETTINLDDLTLNELRQEARRRGLTGTSRLRRQTLLKRLQNDTTRQP